MNRKEAIKNTAALLGCAITIPAALSLFNGCNSAKEPNFHPIFFTNKQALTVAGLAEILLPVKNLSGATGINLPAFIDKVLYKTYPPDARKSFIAGLEEFDNEVKKKYGSGFIHCSTSQQKEITVAEHKAALEGFKKNQSPTKHFLLTLKELSLLCLFTSEYGATKILQYQPVPGSYQGCISLQQAGKAWAT